MRDGHIVSVEPILDLSDDETIKRAWALFEDRQKAGADYGGFEVWELNRMVFQHPKPADDKAQEAG
jgi:hypothetical protein